MINEVFLVSSGSYSDYSIDAVFLTEKEAQEFLDLNDIGYADKFYTIEKFDISTPKELVNKNKNCIVYVFDYETLNHDRTQNRSGVEEKTYHTESYGSKRDDCIVSVVSCKYTPMEKRFKIATDRAAQFKAENEIKSDIIEKEIAETLLEIEKESPDLSAYILNNMDRKNGYFSYTGQKIFLRKLKDTLSKAKG